MANFDIFHNPTKSVPKRDSQIVRIPFEKMDLMNGTMPSPSQSGDLGIQHVPNGGSNGSK